MSRLFKICLPTIAVVCAMLTGCGPEEVVETESLEAPLTGNYGEVLLTYLQPLPEPDAVADEAGVEESGSTSFLVSARFVRVRDIERAEVRSLWGEQLPPTNVPWGECQRLEAPPGGQDTVLGGSLELLDAGELTLQVGDEELRVPNWSFPSVYGVVAGVLYGGEELEVGFRSAQEYRLVSSGSSEIGAFEVTLAAPAELEALTVAGSEVGVEPIALEAGTPMEVRWEPGRASNDILVELSFAQFGVEQRLVCHSQEDGVVDVPQRFAARLWEPGVSDARVAIYRLSRSAFEAEGLDDAEALFVVSTIVPLAIP